MSEQGLTGSAFPVSSADLEELNWTHPPSMHNLSKQTFAELLLEAIDDSLSQLVGTTPQAIYTLLERTFHLNRSEIPVRTELFQEALEYMFGYAAKLVEIQIITRLNRKIGPISNYPSEISDLLLNEYIGAARSGISE